MATTGRQTKGARKGPPEPTAARRTPAWTGARGSPTYSPSTASPHQHPTQAPPIQNSFPPLAQINGARQDNPRDRVLQALSGLTGTTVTLQTKNSQRYEGVVGSTASEGDTAGVTLKDVKDIAAPGTPLKDQLFIASANIDSYTSGPADAKPANGDSFRTDADISHNKGVGRERDLQAWVASDETITPAGNLVGDDDTFGPANGNGNSWDQFSANETLFGVKASFDEDVYTTKLDRSAPDFKERERKAQRIANEIIGAATSNPHIAEERGFNVDDSGVNEEDKYGAVVRGQNAYVPPGARKTGAGSDNVVLTTKGDVPKVSVNGPDGTSVAAQAQSPSPSSKEPSPAPPASGTVSNPTDKPPADPLPAFIAFVTDERRRLTQKRQALVKSEMDKRMAELVKFSKDFKLNKPIPEDLVPILAKDQEKQRAIKEKASKDAASSQARAIGASNPTTASRGLVVAGAKNSDSSRKPITQALGSKIASNNAQASITAANAQKMASAAAASAAAAATAAAAKPAESTTSKKISMVIQTIPPFKGKDKGKQDSNAITTTSSTPVTANGASNQNTTNNNATRNSASPAIVPASPNTIANRLNVNASSFRPNPKANAFNPVPSTKAHAPSAASMSSPKANKPDSAPTTPNPFFGRPIKKTPPVHIKDDFNPFKHNKVVDAAQVATLWPYSGKRYMQLFPTPQYQPAQHPAHMAPPVPPPMPPPSHEEDSAQAAAARGYVYAYPPYGYPAQHMMQGMPPPGPPGAYMPGPYMQPMPYPPGMPPPNAMYSPAMGQMPPQGYMPPPPGAYPPPPNGAGPRPSMPPTPIQANAHPYYHQSPQLQHAYPMMMPPPPNIPPHGYEGGPPPVQMGGHS